MSYLDTDLASRLFPSLLMPRGMLKLIPIFMLWLLFVNKIYAIFRLSLEIEFKSREKFMIRARSLRFPRFIIPMKFLRYVSLYFLYFWYRLKASIENVSSHSIVHSLAIENRETALCTNIWENKWKSMNLE